MAEEMIWEGRSSNGRIFFSVANHRHDYRYDVKQFGNGGNVEIDAVVEEIDEGISQHTQANVPLARQKHLTEEEQGGYEGHQIQIEGGSVAEGSRKAHRPGNEIQNDKENFLPQKPDDGYEWTEQDIYEQSRKIIARWNNT